MHFVKDAQCLKTTEKVSFNIASEASFHFEWTIVKQKCQKWYNLPSFWKPEVGGQTLFPDRSVLIGQKLVENANIQKFRCEILSNFQTMWDAKAVDDMPVPQVFSPPRITEALETLVLAGENSKKQKILSAPLIVVLTSEKPPWDN